MKRIYQRWNEQQIEQLLTLVSAQLATGNTRISWKVISTEIDKTPRQCFDLWTQKCKNSVQEPQKHSILYIPLLNFTEEEYTIDYNFNFELD
ncbi:Myb-like DNA-binding domain-containing protein [Spironucleus salmonicida]|uniref:Myb-like DNA-binding domain-containing protein n=1 Tax=Spironucleus salmonicida TaxID=348837 RepID=V6LAJ8_9EUKA|nr:Myb-like DNA-binding domain-containing protein [Spironucleus salmonicida]|eukprot:EST41437.1 Myb-like DNA-binding domain-containing protein [Spironucleus salmonicida]